MSFLRIVSIITTLLIWTSTCTFGVSSNLPDDAKFAQILSNGAQLATNGKQIEAISEFDIVISGYEKVYHEGENKFFCARTSTESLLYLLEASKTKTSAKVVSSNWAYAYYLKAYSLIELSRISEAKEVLNRAITLSPRNSQFLAELGNIYQREKNWGKALETFQAAESAAREFSPPAMKNAELSRAWRGLGFIYIEQHRLDEAEKIYRQCLKLNASDKKASNELHYIQSLRAKESQQ